MKRTSLHAATLLGKAGERVQQRLATRRDAVADGQTLRQPKRLELSALPLKTSLACPIRRQRSPARTPGCARSTSSVRVVQGPSGARASSRRNRSRRSVTASPSASADSRSAMRGSAWRVPSVPPPRTVGRRQRRNASVIAPRRMPSRNSRRKIKRRCFRCSESTPPRSTPVSWTRPRHVDLRRARPRGTAGRALHGRERPFFQRGLARRACAK